MKRAVKWSRKALVITVVQTFGYNHDRNLYMGPAIPKFGFLVVYAVW